MSGPKSGSYQVVSAAELLRRRVVAADATLDAALERLQVEVTTARALGLHVADDVPSRRRRRSDDPQQTELAAAGVRERTTELRRRCEQQQGEQVRARILQSAYVGLVDEGRHDSARTAHAELLQRIASGSEGGTARPAGAGEDPAVTAARIVARLRDDVPTDQVAHVQDLVRAVAQAEPSEAGGLLDRLRTAQLVANRTALVRTKRLEDLQDLHVGLDGVDGPAAELIRARIDEAMVAVRSGGGADAIDLADLGRQVRAAVTADRRAADRSFALRTLVRAFGDLGYETSVGFDTAVAPQDPVLVSRPEWAGYAVRVVAPASNDRLVLRPVRSAEAPVSTAADQRVEQTFCEDLDDATRLLRDLGVEFTVDKRVRPGTVPVLTVPGDEFGRTAPTPAARRRTAPPRPQQRTLRRPGSPQ